MSQYAKNGVITIPLVELVPAHQWRTIMNYDTNRRPTPEEISKARDECRRILKHSGVPGRLIKFALEARDTRAAELALDMIGGEQDRQGEWGPEVACLLVLSGPTGCGKSTAAAIAMGRVDSGLWVQAQDLARPPGDGDNIETRMKEVDLLVIDDCGTEHSPSGYAMSRICDVICYREGNEVGTIVTTNLDAAKFTERYGERIASRVSGDPLGFQSLSGPDLRVTARDLADVELASGANGTARVGGTRR